MFVALLSAYLKYACNVLTCDITHTCTHTHILVSMSEACKIMRLAILGQEFFGA